jgi:CRISPR/Cas system CMR-associated protein Cmr5 small subunit
MTRQQRWSTEAHKAVLRFKDSPEKEKAKLNTACRKMPSLIQTSGLIQALVFIESRDDGKRFCDDLAKVYDPKLGDKPYKPGDEPRDRLRQKAQKADLAEYLALSRDLINVSIWFRRFAQIELGDKDAQDL